MRCDSFASHSIRDALQSRHAQRGVSVMSVLFGLVIASAVAAVGYDQFADSQRKSRIEAASSEVTQIISASQTMFPTGNGLTWVTTTMAVQAGIIPARLRVPGTTTAKNKYNGDIRLQGGQDANMSPVGIISYFAVNRGDCMDLVMDVERRVIRIVVHSALVKDVGVPLDIAALAAACDLADRLDISFVFGRQ